MLAVAVTTFAITTSMNAFGTYVTNAIGLSATSVGMGGTGVAFPMTGMDAIYKNPSLLGYTTTQSGQWVFDGNVGMVSQNQTANPGSGGVNNASSPYFIPDVSATYRLNERLTLGLGVLPYAGASSDYTAIATVLQPKQSLSLVKFAPAISYSGERFSIGVSPYVTWGRFALNDAAEPMGGPQTTRSPSGAVGLGAQIGASFQPVPGVTIGGSYTSESSFTYNNLICIDCLNFPPPGAVTLNNVNIQQPDEIAFGVAVTPVANLDLTFDYRSIRWGHADGYNQFAFQSQSVFSLGGQYHLKAWAFRGGFSYATNPLNSTTGDAGSVPFQGRQISAQAQDILDVFAFPGITTTHITLGAGYKFSEKFSLDAAGYYCPSTSLSRSGNDGLGNPYTFTTSVTQYALSLGATYRL